MVVRDGQVLLDEARGIRLAGTEASLSTNDRFHLGSNTKAMTALMVAKLIEDGSLAGHHAPRALPNKSRCCRFMQVSRYTTLFVMRAAFLVTLRVLTESSGIRSGIVVTMTPFSTREMLSRELLMTEPAATWRLPHSNSGYIVLASALEERLGMAWESLIKEQSLHHSTWTAAASAHPRKMRHCHRHSRGAIECSWRRP